jgi:peroxiredoxin
VELQAKLPGIQKQQLGLAAISYDSPAILKHFADRKKISFALLSDPQSKVIRDYGVLSEGVPPNTPAAVEDRFKPGGQWFGVPIPGTFIIGPDGVVVSKYFEDDYRERYTASDILVREYGESGSTGETKETKHLKLTTSSSSASVKMGQRIALVLDVDLKSQMHVYAPGVQGYVPIEWDLQESPAIKIRPAAYPGSKKLRLKAIKETVPVYEGRFRVARDVTIGSDAAVKPLLNEKRELVIHGTFRYQACDERICYLPQTIPVMWTLQYEALDQERVPAELRR